MQAFLDAYCDLLQEKGPKLGKKLDFAVITDKFENYSFLKNRISDTS